MHGFEFNSIPVTHPGVEQKAAWLQIRQNRPDYVLLWGWGVMNSTALKEAVATGYPRDKMYGVWWAARRARRQGRRRRRQGLQRPGAPARRRAELEDRQGRPRAGPWQGPGHRAQGGGRPGAVHARPDERDARRRRRPARPGAVRQGQVDERRAGALGPREPDARPEEARRARLRRRHAADLDVVRRPHGRRLGAHADVGRRPSGPSRPTGCRPTTRSCGRWSARRPRSTRPRRSSRSGRRRIARLDVSGRACPNGNAPLFKASRAAL